MKSKYMNINNKVKYLIPDKTLYTGKLYKNIIRFASTLMVSESFINEAPVICNNKGNVYYMHPAEDNTAILVVASSDALIEGKVKKVYFGWALNHYVTCTATGETIDIPKELSKRTWGLKEKSTGRVQMVTSKRDGDKWKCKDMSIEEAILSLVMNGTIDKIHYEEEGKEIHHESFVFDARLPDIMLLTKEEHNQRNSSRHQYYVPVYPDASLPKLVLKR